MLDLEVVGQGATTKIYRDGNKAIKLYVNAPADEAANEACLQRFAYNAGLPVPAVFGVRRIDDGKVALDMEYINGQPLIRQGMDKDERRNAIHTLAKLQCAIHKVKAPGLPKQADCIAWKIKNSPHLQNPLKEKLLSRLMSMDNSLDCLCHGDFHPLNILFDGCQYWIIDWVDAVAGSPSADACRTYLLFKQHISRLAGIYLRAFCKESNIKQDEVLAWEPIVAAARSNDNMDDKSRSWLLDIVREWYEAENGVSK